MYKYVFFDLDGTITEPEEGIINGVLYALSKFGITVEDRTTLYPYIGPPLRDSFREFHGLSEEEAEQAVLYYREYYSTKGIYQNGIMPGMEAANEVGVNLKQGYNGDLTSKQAGSIGGQMVKKMIKAYEDGMK